jgi:hypothetical protein
MAALPLAARNDRRERGATVCILRTHPRMATTRLSGRLDARPRASGGDQASAKGERSGRTGIGAVRPPAERDIASLEARSSNREQSGRCRRKQALSDRPAQRQACACVDVAIAVGAAIAAVGARLGNFGRDGHLCRHQASLDERHADPERQEKRQEQCSEPMSRRRVHAREYGAARVPQQGSQVASPLPLDPADQAP